jgi:hypothetical protein
MQTSRCQSEGDAVREVLLKDCMKVLATIKKAGATNHIYKRIEKKILLMNLFKNKLAVITGGGGVLCQEMAYALADRGAKTLMQLEFSVRMQITTFSFIYSELAPSRLLITEIL